MTSVLLVDDDPFVLRVYADGLMRQGFTVWTAAGGLDAVKFLRQTKPDAVVLDLMMSAFSGVEVLKFIREQPGLKELPVVVLSNVYMTDMVRDAASLGANQALLKDGCNPAFLGSCLRDVLSGRTVSVNPSQLLAAPVTATKSNVENPVPAGLPPAAAPAPAGQTEFKTLARDVFEARTEDTRATLRQLFQAFREASNEKQRALRLRDYYRKIHFLTATAGLAGRYSLARMASALEALLYHLQDQPERTSASAKRTLSMTAEFIDQLLSQPEHGTRAAAAAVAYVLVVDDDALSNRLVVTALRQAGLQARSTEEPIEGLQMLRQRHYDLVLLDINLPIIDGFEFHRQLRALPDYEQTPVIYITAHSEFEARARSGLAPMDDVLAKPVFPAELAVKAVMRLLQRPAAA